MPERRVNITGSVLSWAIAHSGIAREDIAAKVRATPAIVRQWELEEEKPTRGQFSALVSALKRPRATFFLPAPPADVAVSPQLRRAPSNPNRVLVSAEALAIREAGRMQAALAWALGEGARSAPLLLPGSNVEEDPETAADRLREWLGVTDAEQEGWTSDSEAARSWRSALERRGIFVFQMSIGRALCRGFSISDAYAPAIVVNSAYSMGARTYTLMHELGHLVTHTDSVCTGFVASDAAGADMAYERWCEQFAAALLMPRAPMTRFLTARYRWKAGRTVVSSVADAVSIANRFSVSIRAAALRAIDLGAASPSLYRLVDDAAQVRDINSGGGGGGDRRPAVRIREYGPRSVRVLRDAVERGELTEVDVADFFDVHIAEVDELGILAGAR